MKKKGTLLLNILLIILGLFIARPFINFYLEGWQSLSTFESLNLIEVDRSNGDLWGIGNHLYRYRPQLGNTILWGKQIDLPPGYWKDFPSQLCPSQQIWVRYRDEIISYDPDSELWDTEHSELESIGRPRDCFYINGEIAILGEKAIAYKDGPAWKEIQLPAHDENHGKVVIQNHAGEWLLLIGNSFYEMNETTEVWEVITTYEAPRSEDNVLIWLGLYTSDNYYWQGIGWNGVERIQVIENNTHMEAWENLFVEDTIGFEAVEDNFGRVWLASQEETWIFENGEFTHFALPYSVDYVWDIAIDPERERIYFLDLSGITYRSTSYNP